LYQDFLHCIANVCGTVLITNNTRCWKAFWSSYWNTWQYWRNDHNSEMLPVKFILLIFRQLFVS